MTYPRKAAAKCCLTCPHLMLALLSCLEGHQNDEGPRHLIDQWTKDTLWHSFVLVPGLMATGVTWLDLTVIRGQGS